MAATNRKVTIKGVKDGLIFLFDDQCDFADLMEELQHKLENTHQQILTGPLIHVHIKLGNRKIDEHQEEEIRELVRKQGNLLIKSIESNRQRQQDEDTEANAKNFQIIRGIIRSGQTVTFDGSVLYVGDIHPGGAIICTGDIYVMGSLRGMAHAGSGGNPLSIIAASHLRQTQLRIADIISRPPDEWGIEEAVMEFAYLKDQAMEIDKIIHLHRIRPGIFEFKGE